MTAPHVAVTHSLVANGGDAAILLGTLRVLRRAFGDEVRATVFDALPEVARAHYPELDVRPAPHLAAWNPTPASRLGRKTRFLTWAIRAPLLRARARRRPGGPDPLAALASADLAVASGGTYLTETYWLGPTLLDFRLALDAGVPVALLTQSLGPFTKLRVIAAIRDLATRARLVVLRDERSRRHLAEIGVHSSRLHVGADTAFALADADRLAEAAGRTWPEHPRVAVSVREWPYAETTQYHEAIRAAVTHLVRERDAAVVFASTCQGNAAYRYDDGAVAEQIAADLPGDVRQRVTIERGYFRPETLLDLYAGCDLVIATRMHAAILALCAGTPVVPVAYEFKTEELFARLGREDWVEHIERTTPESMTQTVERTIGALAEASGVREELLHAVDAMREDALAAADLVRDAFSDVLAAASPTR